MLTFNSVVLSAQTKPNFTGTWELNVGKSDLGGAPITKLVVQIEHQDPALKYTAKGVADGQDFEENRITYHGWQARPRFPRSRGHYSLGEHNAG